MRLTLPITNVMGAAVGGGACLASLYYIVRALGAQRWPTVEGEIAQSRLVRRDVGAGTGSADYEYVAYRYEVAGKPYRNDRVRFGLVLAPTSLIPGVDDAPADTQADALAARYPDKMRVRVHYNPRDPADSVLFPEPHWAVWIVFAAGALFLWAAFGAR